MRSVHKAILGIVGVAIAFVVAVAGTSSANVALPASSLLRGGFGGAVVVGDGEVFAAEGNNQFRPGMVYVYRKSGNSWRQAAALQGPDAAVYDGFGSTLSFDGNRLFVGAGPAAVHVFTKQGSNWTFSSTVNASAVGGGDDVRFGNAIAASGDWLLIGRAVQISGGGGRGRGGRGRGGAAPPAVPAGAVYAFKRAANGSYAYSATLSSPADDRAGDGFGSAIAFSGNTALIGAAGTPGAAGAQSDAQRLYEAAAQIFGSDAAPPAPANPNVGVVREFTVDAAGAWTHRRAFAPIGLQSNALFGAALVTAGDLAVVTAANDGGGYGSAFVMRKVPQGQGRGGGGGRGRGAVGDSTWVEMARLAPPSGRRGEGYGVSLAADGREVFVGAPGASTTGGVYAYAYDSSGFGTGAVKFLAPQLSDAASAGVSVSVRGNVAAVGASSANRGQGALIIFERNARGEWVPQPVITVAMDEIMAMTGSERRCSEEGKVEVFDCNSAELQSFLPPSKLTHDAHYIQMNDIWGWTDAQTGKEWALIGRRDGATFVDMSNPLQPIPVADLPLTEGANPASWRDIKVYKDHAYIVSDGAGRHGMQIFDLTRLRSLRPQRNGQPVMVRPDTTYRDINSAHNIVINEESGYAYAVGASAGGTTCGGGLHMIDIREPKAAKFVGCFADTTTGRSGTGYSHDAQCVMYKGPDRRYTGREICLGSNETAISVADVTDKQNPKALSRASYPNVAYAHQGWLTEDHRYFFLDDELDESSRGIEKTRTLIWDLADLENPKLVKEHMGVESTIDHNLYITGNQMYQANYRSGLRILDVSDPENPKEVAHFDTDPYRPNATGFNGAWSVYPFFKSGTVIISSIEQGLFLVKQRKVIF